MFTSAIDPELLEFSLAQYDAGVSVEQLTSTKHFSAASFSRAKKKKDERGYIPPPGKSTGRPSKADTNTVEWVLSLLRVRPTMYLDEVVDMLARYHDVKVHKTTVFRWLKKHNLTSKKLARKARQRDQRRRGVYAMYMTQFRPDQLVFADETHFNDRNALRTYVWAPTPQRASVSSDFTRGTKWSLLPALSQDGMFGAYITEGSITREKFLYWIDHFALPNMRPFPEERSVLVVDNCSIHKGEDVRAKIEAAGCRLVFLPPYSPDLNPIEMAFSSIKSQLRRKQDASRFSVLCACDQVQQPHARSYFQSCGYGRGA